MLTDSAELRRIIRQSGMKYGHLAEIVGVTPYSLQKKIDNITEFKASEIKRICDALGIQAPERDRIFFFNVA